MFSSFAAFPVHSLQRRRHQQVNPVCHRSSRTTPVCYLFEVWKSIKRAPKICLPFTGIRCVFPISIFSRINCPLLKNFRIVWYWPIVPWSVLPGNFEYTLCSVNPLHAWNLFFVKFLNQPFTKTQFLFATWFAVVVHFARLVSLFGLFSMYKSVCQKVFFFWNFLQMNFKLVWSISLSCKWDSLCSRYPKSSPKCAGVSFLYYLKSLGIRSSFSSHFQCVLFYTHSLQLFCTYSWREISLFRKGVPRI